MGSIAASGSAIAQTAGASAAMPAPGPAPAGTAVWQEGFMAIPSVGVLEVAALQLAPRFSLVDATPIGPDLRSRWRRRS